ncbi:MAG TPA: HD domain-containing protein [Longimicrobiaceae bacterium]
MRWLRRLFAGPREDRALPRIPDPLTPQSEDTQLDLAAALTFALYAGEPRLRVGEHCARVARLVGRMARELEIVGDHRRALLRAAQLHEVGMIAVPLELVEFPGRLAPDQLARIRAQALFGAEIVRKTEGLLTAWLVQHQYTDHQVLRRRFPDHGRELLLAGLFRVADVADALTVPRPYQDRLPEARRRDVLFQGSGTRFHPEAVEALLEMGPLAA